MNKEEAVIAQKILGGISTKKGVLWEKIAEFQSQLEEVEGVLTHKAGEVQSKGLKKIAPLKHNFEGGLYTRTMYMPKGSIIVSMIHRQQHPSFLLKGELSYLTDEGEVKRNMSGAATILAAVAAAGALTSAGMSFSQAKKARKDAKTAKIRAEKLRAEARRNLEKLKYSFDELNIPLDVYKQAEDSVSLTQKNVYSSTSRR